MFNAIVCEITPVLWAIFVACFVRLVYKRIHDNDAVGTPIVVDATMLGHYDRQLGYSLSTWIYAVKVNVYTYDKNLSIDDVIMSWYESCTHDPQGIIYLAIENAKTRFLSVLEDARLEQDGYDSQYITETVKPKFKCDSTYDYHELSKTLQYNDYLNMPELVRRVDEFMEGVAK